jgi:hypothetical protein
MVKLISHRGNLDGRDLSRENNPAAIEDAIKKGFDVEVDLRVIEKKFYLGHDSPETLIEESFLDELSQNLWLHCKNIEALENSIIRQWHCFYHESDKYTLTSKNYVWCFPGMISNHPKSIVVLPENVYEGRLDKYGEFYSICTDFVIHYDEILKS